MTTSNLLNSPAGVLALKEATCDIIRMRIRRWFQRNTVIGFDNWVLNGKQPFTQNDALQILDSLNIYHDREILDLLDCLKQIEDTFSDISLDWYVDTINGDDTNGDGSQAHPFKTITKVQGYIGQNSYINGKINIFVSAPISEPIKAFDDWKLIFGKSGQLTIQGLDAPQVTSAGPHTVAGGGFVNLGTAATMGHEITITAASLVPNAHVGEFIHMLTGTKAGNYYCILENTASKLYIGLTTDPITAADTFEIVLPGTKIRFGSPSPVDLDFEGLQAYEQTYGDRFIMTGIHFRGDLQLRSKYMGITFGFCNLSTTTKLLNCSSMYINLCNPIDAAVILNTKMMNGKTPLVYLNSIWSESFTWVNTRRITFGTLTVNGPGGQLSMDWSAGKQVSNFAGNININTKLCATHNTSNFQYISNMSLANIYLLGCVDAVNMILATGFLTLSNVEAVAAPTGYTIRASALSKILVGLANVVNGVTNDVYWVFSAAPAAFPVAGASITDGDGAYLLGS